MKFDKILIANRGEIAGRIIRSCRRMGIRSVAVYSDADRSMPYVTEADEAMGIGAPAPADSYLNAEKIIAIAKKTGATGIHPGYGFLSENAEFAETVERAGIRFIGPSPDAMRKLGSKTSGRRIAHALGIPTLAGTIEPVHDEAECRAVADRIGYPVILKAAGGGGGKGMRPVYTGAEFESALARSRSEAKAAFGDDRIFLEKFLENPRHVEVQVLADRFGNAIHLGERECTIQRRHQKIVEESPCFLLQDKTRSDLFRAALDIVRAAGYTNAGTVEFILDERGNFYFLEVNTRLQVEHPVTEFRTGIDLVREQILIALGEHLSIRQEEVRFDGHAIECRIYAEDSANSFFPSTGDIVHLHLPAGPGIRNDFGYSAGNQVPRFYDALIGKMICHARNRPDAIDRITAALDETELFGVRNNLDLCSWIVRHPLFRQGDFDTNFLHKYFTSQGILVDTEKLDKLCIAAACNAMDSSRSNKLIPTSTSSTVRRWRDQAIPGSE